MIRIGVIGCGNRSFIAFHALEFPDTVIAAGADPSQENLEKFRNQLKTDFHAEMNVYSDYREMIGKENLSAVIITSPDHFHAEQSMYAMKHGLGVYLEKPLAITLEECNDILRCAREENARLQIGHNMRYLWFTNKMKEIIDSGAIGEVQAIWVRHFVSYGDGYFRKWYSRREHINSLLVQKGAHDIDIIHMLAGSYTERVSGYGKLSVYDKLPRRKPGEPVPVYKDRSLNWPHKDMKDFSPEISINDHNMILMQLRNGVQASYMQCFYTPDTVRNYTVIGTQGRLENYGDLGGGACIQVWNTREDRFRLEGDVTWREPRQNGSGHGGADASIIRSFLRYLRGEETPVIRPQDAWYAAACGIAGAESIRHGNIPVDIPELAPDLENCRF